MDIPHIYEMYRALPAGDNAGYAIPDLGSVFTIDYNIYPEQYRYTDSLASILDLVVNVDNVHPDSNLLKGVIGVSSLKNYWVSKILPRSKFTSHVIIFRRIPQEGA